MEIDPIAAEHLFKAVVAQALIDACAPDRTFSTKPPRRREGEDDIKYAKRTAEAFAYRKVSAAAPRSEARLWFKKADADFALVCSLAGYDPDDIRERAAALAERGWAGVALAAA